MISKQADYLVCVTCCEQRHPNMNHFRDHSTSARRSHLFQNENAVYIEYIKHKNNSRCYK